jgi:hypothetical protein
MLSCSHALRFGGVGEHRPMLTRNIAVAICCRIRGHRGFVDRSHLTKRMSMMVCRGDPGRSFSSLGLAVYNVEP